ncbi:nitroreductase family protein [Thermosediminibacter oceani]|uniref:Nitroreductase n=1 Tax=Thermosediminibacter oceani (strain ATCC BAA-1034 / DSM 16646 / JW/IW-1228P) TaxID=555079 RepID=D9RYF4_THEOJ|nr:nitroreductase family protein [Thermosediminibacter oceani]ADL08378.1 nitroreductase [Thermosediminibacter oceani DSM 16646]
MNETIRVLKERRSIRQYAARPIPREILEDIVDCARLAPSANNVQPWVFVVVTNEEGKKELARLATWGKFIADAAACVAVFCEKDNNHAVEDGSAATENIILAAKAYGIGSCWVAGYRRPYSDEVRRLLGVPEKYELISLVPLGYSDKTPNPPKKPLSEVLKWEKYE